LATPVSAVLVQKTDRRREVLRGVGLVVLIALLGLCSGKGARLAGVLLLTLAPINLPSAVMVGRAYPWRLLVVLAVFTASLGSFDGGAAVRLHL
jgi:hypothetical protein